MPKALQAIRHRLLWFLPALPVTLPVTTDAKRNQVVHHIAPKPAPSFHVMDLQAFHGTTLLTPPTISFEHTFPEDCVLFCIQFESRSFLAQTRRLCRSSHRESMIEFRSGWPLPENRRRSSPDSNLLTCLSRASTQQFRAPVRSPTAGSCTP
jgi:hypothetical protein